MPNILDSAFKYVPPASQDQDGVLALWLKQRRAEQEVERKRVEARAMLGVVTLDRKRHARG